MTDSTEQLLGELRADVRALRKDHRLHAERTEALVAKVEDIRVELGELRGRAKGEAIWRHSVAAIVGALFGLFGGHVPLPGAH